MPSKEIVIKKSRLTPTVLIAGGGFIGSHLAEKLLLQDARVVLVDSLQNEKELFLKNLSRNPKFVFFDADISEELPEKIKSVDYVVYAGLDSHLSNAFSVKNLLELTKKSEAKFLLVSSMASKNDEAYRFAEALTREYFESGGVDARIVRLPFVYGPRMGLDEAGVLGQALSNAIKHRDLKLDGEEAEEGYYLYVSDATDGLAKALFNSGTEGEVFSLVPPDTTTGIELGYLVKGLADAGLKVDFTGKGGLDAHESPDTKNLGLLRWKPKVEMKDGLTKTLLWLGYTPNEHGFKPTKLIENKKKEKETAKSEQIMSLVDEVKQSIESISLVPHTQTKKSKKGRLALPRMPKPPKLEFSKQRWAAVGAALLAVVLIPIVLTGVYAATGARNLQRAGQEVLSLNSQAAQDYTNKAFRNFSLAETSLSNSGWLFQVLGKQESFNSYSSLLSSAKYFSKAAYDSTKAVHPYATLFEAIKPNTTTVLDTGGFENSKLLMKQAKTNFDRAYAEFKNIDTNVLPGYLATSLDTYGVGLSAALQYVDTAATASGEIPNLLGINEPKTYLILFQNSNEIRPTGGFIGSYATVDIQNGKISSITIDDVYNPDGQIDLRDIRLPVPTVLGEALEEDRLHIRNANWNPDFTQSAQVISDLYFRVTGKDVDGVLAVDLNFVQEILRVTGPVYLTAFGEEISAENLYERSQYHSEFNFEAGSDQKRQFLTILGGKVLETLFALPQERMDELLNTANKLLEEKHLLISLPNNPLSVEMQKHGWDGGLAETAGDYLYAVNANIGGTKANYFVQNEMKYLVSSQTRDGLLRSELKLTYKHTGEDNAWPGGPYTNYVRVFTQNGSKLTNATLGRPGELGENILEDIVISSENSRTVFAQQIVLNPQEEVTLTLYYDLPESLSLRNGNESYNLYWQKQPGTEADLVSFTFEPPFGTTTTGQTQIQTNLNTDKTFFVSLN